MSISEAAATQLKDQAHADSNPFSNRGSRKRARQHESAFRGVRKRAWGRYVSEIRIPGQKTRIWLGSFGSPEMAARAYDSAAFFLKGSSACLNFPHLAELLPRPRSSSRKDIQSAASKAALEPVERYRDQDPTRSSGEMDFLDSDLTEWWDLGQLGNGSSLTTSFGDVKYAPLLSPFWLDSEIGELPWIEGMDDEILMAAISQSDFYFVFG